MSRTRLSWSLTAALVCSLSALGAASAAAHAEQPRAAIRSDTHRLAVDVGREAQLLGRGARRHADHLGRTLHATGERLSLQLDHVGHRMQRWWERLRAS